MKMTGSMTQPLAGMDGPDVLDEDDFTSDSATAVPTQQSTKAYVDAAVSSITPITLGTEQASTSGTAIDFGSIPAGTKRITINCVGVSTNGTAVLIVQIGDSGGIEDSGYSGSGQTIGGTAANYTSGFAAFSTNAAASVNHGAFTLTLQDAANNEWVATGILSRSDSAAVGVGSGSKTLSATLDRVRVTTVGGSDTFDAGVINIMYE